MLYLIGLGLYDEKDITLRGLETAKLCDAVYIELYTSKWLGKKNLERLLGVSVKELQRGDLEEKMNALIEEARTSDIAILVPGDPLVATTHSALLLEARRAGVDVRAIHAPSIISAVAATGLSIYRFGKTCTIPRPQEAYDPTSFYDVILENQRVNAHTLCLLDIGDRPMTVKEAVERLETAERKHKKGLFNSERHVIAVSFGAADVVEYATLGQFKTADFPTPAAIIVPAKMSDIEQALVESKHY